MGTTPSKTETDNKSITPNNMRKFSKSAKISKTEQIQKKFDIIQNVQTEIDLFAGDRRSPRYSQIQETLTSISKDFQDTKNTTSKQKTREKCDYALNDIQKCLQRLENRVSFNEHHLDGAAVESHSFINHTFSLPPQPEPVESPPVSSNRTVSPSLLQPRDYEHAQTIDRLEHETHKLEQDVKLSTQLDDTKQLTFLEKKIQILYTDLEMIVVDNRNPLSDTKAVIGKRLIKCNNQIKKYKRISVHGKQNALGRIERKLENLEIEALTFEGVKNDVKYKEIEQDLKNYLNEVNQMDELYNTKDIVEKIKNTLNELEIRAEENHKQQEADEKLKQLEGTNKVLQDQVKQYKGTTSDSSYIQLDQNLRNVWANAAEIENINEHIRLRKERSISNVQNLLKSLNQNAQKGENQNLTKIKELQTLWNEIDKELDVQNVQSDVSKSITEVLKKISEEINKKTKALETIERRKSTGNLVVTKIIHLEDVSKSQVSLTDIPMKTEIKVQPILTTITEVQRIESEIKSLCHEIKQSSFTKNSNHYQKFQQKLEQFNNALMRIESNKNGTIDSNKRRALKALREAYGVLEEKKEKSDRTSKVFEVMDVHSEIQYYRQQIKTFKSVVKDHNYEKIKQGLSNCLTKLQVTGEEHATKQDFIRQIQQYHQELETKLAENQAKVKLNEKAAELKRQSSQETKNVIEKVQKLKSQVERFSGVYEGLHFKQIQEELINCNKKLETIDSFGDERLESAKVQTKQKIRKYLKILEEKSTKNEIVPENDKSQDLEEKPTKNETVTDNRKSQILDVPHRKINAIRERLVVIKMQTEEFNGEYKDKEYTNIERELLTCLDELRMVEDQGHKSVVTSKEQYEDYIIKLLAYFEDKTKLRMSESKPTNEEAFKIQDPTKTLTAIENNIRMLKSQVETSSEDFAELRKQEASLRKELEEVEVGNVAHVRDIKKQLADSLQECAGKLEENISILKKIKDVKEKVGEVSRVVRQFSGTKNDDQYSYLDETLIRLMLDLDNINCFRSGTLNNAKADARKLIEKSMKALTERVKSVPILI